jgi:hypothetical protein
MRRGTKLVIALAIVAALVVVWRGVEFLRARAREVIAGVAQNFDYQFAMYSRLRPYKALAVSFDKPDGRWAWGWAYGCVTMNDAVHVADERCQVGRQKEHLVSPCRLYSVNDEVVLDYSADALQNLLNRYESIHSLRTK